MYVINFDKSKTALSEHKCPACKSEKANALLTVEAENARVGKLELATCKSCGTAFFLGDDPVIGYDHEGFAQDYWYNYVQSGAGIDAMLHPVLALGDRAKGSLLDVGCGFGFVPHFWTEMGFGEAIGLESSLYGRKGRELLGVEIYHSYFNECEEIRGRRFDIVFSSEVIEHVRDPAAFIKEISAGLKPGGVLVLTTPSSTCLVPSTEATTISATLSPGFHYFILSRNALEKLLKEAGFAHVHVVDLGQRLFAWASDSPFPTPDTKSFDRDTYLDYLEKLSLSNDAHVRGGALYRLLKDSLNTNRPAMARLAYPRFEALALETYGVDFLNPELSEAARRARTSLDNEHFPAWLGCGLLFAAIYRSNFLNDLDGKTRLLRAAIETMEKEAEIGLQFAQEPVHFMPLARQSYQQSLLELFERDTCGIGSVLPSKDSMRTLARIYARLHSFGTLWERTRGKGKRFFEKQTRSIRKRLS